MTKKLLLITALPFLLGACNEITGPPDIQSLHEARPVSETKELNVDVKYDVGELEISKASDDNLFSLDLQYDRRRSEPRFSFNDGERSTMRLDMDSHGAGFGLTGHGVHVVLHLLHCHRRCPSRGRSAMRDLSRTTAR